MVNLIVKYSEDPTLLVCDFLGSFSISGSITVGGDATVTGNVNVGGDLDVTGSTNIGVDETFTGNLVLDYTTDSDNGIIMKDTVTFIHDFKHPTGGTAIPVGKNIFIGYDAGNLTTGSTATETYHASDNLAIGSSALDAVTTGYSNISIGNDSMLRITTGDSNIAIGKSSLQYTTTGYLNLAIGETSLSSNTGNENLAIGYYSMGAKVTGNRNLALGYMAGVYRGVGSDYLETCNDSCFIGYGARASADSSTNEIVIGYNAYGLGNNSVVLGNSSITLTRLRGNVGFGVDAPTSLIHGDTTLSAATGNEVAYTLNYTTNKASSGDDTGLLINHTDTASPGTSYLIDAQVGGTSRFNVKNTGDVTLANATAQLLLPLSNDATTPTLAFGDGDTGFYESSDDVLLYSRAGTAEFQFQTNVFQGVTDGSGTIRNGASGATTATFYIKGDDDTGIGSAAADQLSLVSGGKEMMRLVEDTVSYIQVPNDSWIRAVDYAGTGSVNMFKINASDEIEVGGALTLASGLEYAEDSGAVTLVNMPVSSSATDGTEESYSVSIDSTPILKVKASSNGAGAIDEHQVIFLTSATGTASLPTLAFGDADTGFYESADDTLKLSIGGTAEVVFTATAIYPETSDGLVLGSATNMFSDLFLADGSVINFNNGNVTITHSADTLTFTKALIQTPDSITATSEGVAAALTTVQTHITTNGDEDLDNVTLSNGTEGQVKIFAVKAVGHANDSVKITPATMVGGTQITFGASPLGLGCSMVYTSAGWVVTGNNGGVIA